MTTQSPLLSGSKVKLRAYTRADLELAVQYINDFEVRELMWPGIMFPFRKEDEEKWYESFNAMSDGVYNFAIERNDTRQYIGGCGINEVNQKSRHATIGILIGSEHQNMGFGTEAMQLLVDFCFMEMNMHKVKLHVFDFNKRAVRCYQKVGFQQEGLLKEELYRKGRYNDEILMGILKSDWEKLRHQ